MTSSYHISSGWVKIRFHTENQLPRLSGGGGPTKYFVTPTSVHLN